MTYNSVLKNTFEVTEAERGLQELRLGCYESPILPMLKRLGFVNLYGCDLVLKLDNNTTLMKSSPSVYHEDYEPIVEMYNDKSYQLSIRNIEDTNYRNQMFDYVTSLSVIEHGVNIEKYFSEMSRIIKNNGYLLTSTDYCLIN